MTENQTLKEVYALIAELWCSPPEDEATRVEFRETAEQVVEKLESIDVEGAMLLSMFLRENDIVEEDYIDLFELDPECALYLGSHTYDEPTTCATAAVSDRNAYMIELGGIYSHFGRKPNGNELPDFLPLMVNFLSLTAESKNDPVKDKFINEYVLPFLPPMRLRLKELETPYIHLLDALEKVINIEVDTQSKTQPLSKQREQQVEHHVG